MSARKNIAKSKLSEALLTGRRLILLFSSLTCIGSVIVPTRP